MHVVTTAASGFVSSFEWAEVVADREQNTSEPPREVVQDAKAALLGRNRRGELVADPFAHTVAASTSARAWPEHFTDGMIVDKWRLRAKLGEGGFGWVYAVEHVELPERRAAIKFLRPDIAAAEQTLARFRREAKLMCELHGDHVVDVFDFGHLPNGGPYLVMELLEGEDLGERLGRGVLSIAELENVAAQACAGLQAIHDKGVVHRDIKPSNIFLCGSPPGRIKLLDFGLSKEEGELTASRTQIGSLRYTAPELLDGRSADATPRSDLFALGAVLYEAAVGRRAFDRKNAEGIMHQIAFVDPPHPRELRPELPAGAAEAVVAALAKNPEQRPVSASAFLELLTSRASPERAGPRRDATRVLRLVGLALVVATVVVAAALSFAGPSPSPPAERFSAGLEVSTAISETPDRSWRAPPGMRVVEGGAFEMGTADVEGVVAACAAANARREEACRRILAREQASAGLRRVPSFALDEVEVDSGSFARWLSTRAVGVAFEERAGASYVVDPTDDQPLLMLFRGGPLQRKGDAVVSVATLERTPARAVALAGASRYCHELGKRLPTEVEWEYAARGPAATQHVGGPTPPRCDVAVFGRGKVKRCDGEAVPLPVDRPVADVAWSGVRDMAGNVSEWVAAIEEQHGVYKGGSFADDATLVRPATRNFGDPERPFANVGFRCAADRSPPR